MPLDEPERDIIDILRREEVCGVEPPTHPRMKKIYARLFHPFRSIREMLDLLADPRWLSAIVIFAVLYGPFLWEYGWGYRDYDYVDLPSFYSASVQVFSNGGSPYDRDRLQAVMGQDVYVYPYLYPPPCLPLYWPLSLLTYASAGLAVLAVNHLLLFAILWCVPLFLLQRPDGSLPLSCAVTFVYLLTFYPIVLTLNHGQVNLLLLGFLLAFWVLARRERRIAASFFLALAILLKAYPLIVVALLLLTPRRREAVYTMSWLALLSGLSLLIVPTAAWAEWFARVLPTGGYVHTPAGLFSPAAIWNQSLNGFFSRAFTLSEWSRPETVDPLLARRLTYLAAGIVAAITGAAAWRGSRFHAAGLERTLLPALPAMYLLAPLSWEHHLVYVLPSVLLLLTARSRLSRAWTAGFYVACLVPAVIIAMPGMLAYKVYAVTILWALCIFAACSRSIELPDGSIAGGEA